MFNIKKILSKYLPEWFELLLITILYSISNIWLLLNRGMYWDEQTWLTLINLNKWATFWSTLEQQKQYAQYYLAKILAASGDLLFAHKLVAFLGWLIAALIIYVILRRIFKFATPSAFFISALFALSPSFFERANGSIILYSVCTVFFYLAALLYWSSAHAKHRYVRSIYITTSIVFFFLSFFTNSYLVFFYGFIALTFIHRTTIVTTLRARILLCFLPVVFWILKVLAGNPYGLTSNYNEFIFGKSGFVWHLINDLWSGIFSGLIWPLSSSLALLDRKIFVVIFLLSVGLIYFIIRKSNNIHETENLEIEKHDKYGYIIWGIFFFMLGLVAYLVVGKAPHPHPFQMRHAMLLPLGFGLIFWSTLELTVRARYRMIMASIICALFMTWNTYNYIMLDMDWYKQRAIMANLHERTTELTLEPTVIVFHDTIRQFGWMNRPLGLSDYFGIVTTGLGTTTTIGIPSEEDLNLPQIFELRHWMTGDPSFDKSARIIHMAIISHSSADMVTVKNWLQLKWLELHGTKQDFENELDRRFEIDLVPYVASYVEGKH